MRGYVNFLNGSSLADNFLLMRNFNRFFDSTSEETFQIAPQCDIQENETHFLLSFDIPGVNKDAFKIEVKDQHLIVSAERKTELNEKQKVHLNERTSGKYYRAVELPENIQTEKIEATYGDGVLRIEIAKAEEVKPKQIQVKVQDTKSLN